MRQHRDGGLPDAPHGAHEVALDEVGGGACPGQGIRSGAHLGIRLGRPGEEMEREPDRQRDAGLPEAYRSHGGSVGVAQGTVNETHRGASPGSRPTRQPRGVP